MKKFLLPFLLLWSVSCCCQNIGYINSLHSLPADSFMRVNVTHGYIISLDQKGRISTKLAHQMDSVYKTWYWYYPPQPTAPDGSIYAIVVGPELKSKDKSVPFLMYAGKIIDRSKWYLFVPIDKLQPF